MSNYELGFELAYLGVLTCLLQWLFIARRAFFFKVAIFLPPSFSIFSFFVVPCDAMGNRFKVRQTLLMLHIRGSWQTKSSFSTPQSNFFSFLPCLFVPPIPLCCSNDDNDCQEISETSLAQQCEIGTNTAEGSPGISCVLLSLSDSGPIIAYICDLSN